MKKTAFTLLILPLFFCLFGFNTKIETNTIDDIRLLDIAVISYDGHLGKAYLYGYGDNYITDLKLVVEFKGYEPYEIKLVDGYSPNIETFDFGAEDKFLFFSSQTGGSGGYGNYLIYELKTKSYNLLYNDKLDSERNKFSAKFNPNGFMNIKDEQTTNSLDVYVGYMDKVYYDMIFDENAVPKGEQPYVNDISFVSPAYNPASDVYRLLTYRSVVAVAEVNRLGYVVQTLDFVEDKFIPTFTEFSINI